MVDILKSFVKNFGYSSSDIKSLLWNGLIIAAGSFVVFILQHVKISLGLDPVTETAIVTFLIKALNKLVVNTSENTPAIAPVAK